jgi:flagellar hook-length control protein FliK
VSSIASHVSATATIGSVRQQQTPGSAPDSDTDPFAAVLEAVASTPDTIKPSAAAQHALPPTSADGSAAKTGNSGTGAAVDFKLISSTPNGGQPDVAAKGSAAPNTSDSAAAPGASNNLILTAMSGANSGAANTANTAATMSAANAVVSLPVAKGNGAATTAASKLNAVLAAASHATAQASAGAKVAANSTNGATAPAAETAPSAPPQFGSTAANPIKTAKTAPAKAKLPADAAATQAAQTQATSTQQQTAPAPTQDTSGDTTSATQSDSTASAPAATTAPAVSQQPAATSAQPVAAAVAVAVAVSANSIPTTGNTAAADATIGDTNKTRARLVLPTAGGKNAAATPAIDDSTPAKPTPAANKADGAVSKLPRPSGDSSNAQATDSSVTQQQPPQPDNGLPAQLTGGTPAVADQPAPRVDLLAAAAAPDSAGSPDAQSRSFGAKADTAGLPNFGLSAANAPAPSATVAAATTTGAAGTVPIAGLAVAIASRAQAGSNQFDIRLDPPELGRIDVRLDVDRDGHVTSHLTVDRADTLQLLQNQQPQLQQALEQAGLKTADNGLQFTLRDQSFAGQNNNGGGAQPSAAQLVIPDADLPVVQSTQAYNRMGLGTGIDIRV